MLSAALDLVLGLGAACACFGGRIRGGRRGCGGGRARVGGLFGACLGGFGLG